MGVGRSFGEAYAKALIAAGQKSPNSGGIFLSIRNEDKSTILKLLVHCTAWVLNCMQPVELTMPSQHWVFLSTGQ